MFEKKSKYNEIFNMIVVQNLMKLFKIYMNYLKYDLYCLRFNKIVSNLTKLFKL